MSRLEKYRLRRLAAGCAALFAMGMAAPAWAQGLERIEHIVVIYAENRSFDNLYGLFPGANGIAQARPENTVQVDHDGQPFAALPPVWKGKAPDPKFPADLPNKPFRIDAPPIDLPLSVATRDLVHRYYQNIEQINGGRNDRFAAISDAGGLAMGYYDGSKLPLWQWAREYTLADNFFMGAFGGSFLNHFWLVCACTPYSEHAPDKERASTDAQGRIKRAPESSSSAMNGAPRFLDGEFTPDGYAVNTVQPPYQPSRVPPAGDARFADPARHPLPPQTFRTIGDTLSAKGISWTWYAQSWNAALADGMQPAAEKRSVIYGRKPGWPSFEAHHQPFNYFKRFAPGTPDRERHIKDGEHFLAAIESGTLPQVSFYKPDSSRNEHPGYTDVLSGDRHIAQIVAKIKASPLWQGVAIIVTYDENGGFWDHVPPPKGDRWGPGTRVPAIIVSPFARRGFVDSTPYDTTSIIKLITRRFGLEPLPGARAGMGDLTHAFDFSRR
jgi:phospholipase C